MPMPMLPVLLLKMLPAEAVQTEFKVLAPQDKPVPAVILVEGVSKNVFQFVVEAVRGIVKPVSAWIVALPPITNLEPVTVRPVPVERVPVATVPRVEGVPIPVQYARPPMVGMVEVETAP